MGNDGVSNSDRLGLRGVTDDESFDVSFKFTHWVLAFKWKCEATLEYCCSDGQWQKFEFDGNGRRSVVIDYQTAAGVDINEDGKISKEERDSASLIQPFFTDLSFYSKEMAEANWESYAEAFNQVLASLTASVRAAQIQKCIIKRDRKIRCRGEMASVGILPSGEGEPISDIPKDLGSEGRDPSQPLPIIY